MSAAALELAAKRLNAATDRLSKAIEGVEAELKRIGLGVSARVEIVVDGTPATVGYEKFSGKWGLTLTAGQTWRFNDGPRELRVVAVKALPDLFIELERRARDMMALVEAAEAAVPK